MKRIFCLAGFAIILLSCAAGAFENTPVGWVTLTDNNAPYTITGGSAGTVVVATNEVDFKAYAASGNSYVILVPNVITMTRGTSSSDQPQKVDVQYNKTIIGVGPNAGINGSLQIKNRENVIIRNLRIWYEDGTQGTDSPWTDGISISNSRHVWIDHCTVYDTPDSLIDTTSQSNYVTISWCKFYYSAGSLNTGHHFTNIVGGDDLDYGDRGKLKITFHHNWWTNGCLERMPRARFGRVHCFNNYYSSSNLANGGYCAGVGVECSILLDNNYFNNVKYPWKDYSQTGIQGLIGWNSGNVFAGTTIIPTWAPNDYNDPNMFVIPYSYTLDDGDDVPEIVMAGAGAPLCYGDFDRNKSVDFDDLESFIEYWLDTSDIVNAEYFNDGIINFLEFAMMAQNWRRTDFTAPSAPTNLSTTDGNSTTSLDWSDNSEGDLAGYNVYRSTIFGCNYNKLNGPLLSSSNYVDNTVTNGTIYYYVVTAVDTSSNESQYSDLVSAIPLSAGNIIIQENLTGFCSINGVIDKTFINYSGTGYAKTNMSVGSGINWRVNVPSSGTYTLKWRHAHGAGTRNAKLLINDVEFPSTISFPATGAGYIWSQLSVDVSLTSGTNNIRLQSATGNYSGLPLIDYMMVTGDEPEAESCS